MEHGHSREEVKQRINGIGLPGSSGLSRYLRDFVYGGIDGAVTTFAIVAGVQGAGLSPTIVLVLGIANVLADGFSMAAGNYSGTKAELDDVARIREIERRHIRDMPEGELEEIRQILKLKGIDGPTLDQAVACIARDENNWIDLMLVDEYGKSPVDPNPLSSAIATFSAFLVCGMVPLLPYLLNTGNDFLISTIATGATFLAIGMLKSSWSLAPWWRSGIETLLIGSIAASIAYGVGYFVAYIAG